MSRPSCAIRRRVIRDSEALQTYEHRFMARARDALTEAIARDLGASPDDLEPRMAAAATLAVFEVLEAAERPLEEAVELVDRALALHRRRHRRARRLTTSRQRPDGVAAAARAARR